MKTCDLSSYLIVLVIDRQ